LEGELSRNEGVQASIEEREREMEVLKAQIEEEQQAREEVEKAIKEVDAAKVAEIAAIQDRLDEETRRYSAQDELLREREEQLLSMKAEAEHLASRNKSVEDIIQERNEEVVSLRSELEKVSKTSGSVGEEIMKKERLIADIRQELNREMQRRQELEQELISVSLASDTPIPSDGSSGTTPEEMMALQQKDKELEELLTEKHRLRVERLEEEAKTEPELSVAVGKDGVATSQEYLQDVIGQISEKSEELGTEVSQLESPEAVDELQQDIIDRMTDLANVTEELSRTKAEMVTALEDLESKRRELEESTTPEPEPEPEKAAKKKKKKKAKKVDERLAAEGLEMPPGELKGKKKTLKYIEYHRRLRDMEELPEDDVEALEQIQEELALLSPEEILIPQDIYTFFTSPGGHSLLIRGATKTGKTTIALQMVEELAEVEELLYVPSRKSERRRFIQFPWLLEKEEKDREYLSQRLMRRSPAPQEILNIYARVAKRSPAPTIVVLDRIDKMAERHRVDVGDLVELLHRDLASRSKAQLLFVQEQSRLRGLEAMVDGCMVLKPFSEDDQEFTGSLEIVKLMDIDIQEPRFFYKIKGGRFSFMKGVRSF
jgi:hypothetical protein